MSRTKRRKQSIHNTVLHSTKEDGWKETADKKPFYKPTSKFKKNEGRRQKSKPKQAFKEAVARGKDFDDVALPVDKKENDWLWF